MAGNHLEMSGTIKRSRLVFALILVALTLLVLPACLGRIQQVEAADTRFVHANLEPLPCYGPCIISNISSNAAIIGESVIVMGEICPPKNNLTVRVVFTRPDYSWIDRYVLSDNVTGEFTVEQTLDMAGFWNIFPVYDHINDRLYVNVTDPNADPNAPQPTPPILHWV